MNMTTVTDDGKIANETVNETVTPKEVEEKVPTSVPEEKSEEKVAEEKKEPLTHAQKRTNNYQQMMVERAAFKAQSELLEKLIRDGVILPKQNGNGVIPEQDVTQRPVKENYKGNTEAYMEALTKYNEALVDAARAVPEVAAKNTLETEWKNKELEAAKVYSDYNDLVYNGDKLVLPDPIVDSILESDYGADIRYFLAKNPDVADKINGMSQLAAIREIGKLESKFEAEKTAKPAAAPKPGMKPISPVKVSGTTTEKDPEKMTDAEWLKMRREQKYSKFKQRN